MFGVRAAPSSPMPEPWQLYHRMMRPMEHYVPFYFEQQSPRLRPSDTALWREDHRLLRLVDAVLSDCDTELRMIAQNAYRLGIAIADRRFRDDVLRNAIDAFLDLNVWTGDDAIPTTLAEATAFVRSAEAAAAPFWPKRPGRRGSK